MQCRRTWELENLSFAIYIRIMRTVETIYNNETMNVVSWPSLLLYYYMYVCGFNFRLDLVLNIKAFFILESYVEFYFKGIQENYWKERKKKKFSLWTNRNLHMVVLFNAKSFWTEKNSLICLPMKIHFSTNLAWLLIGR